MLQFFKRSPREVEKAAVREVDLVLHGQERNQARDVLHEQAGVAFTITQRVVRQGHSGPKGWVVVRHA